MRNAELFLRFKTSLEGELCKKALLADAQGRLSLYIG